MGLFGKDDWLVPLEIPFSTVDLIIDLMKDKAVEAGTYMRTKEMIVRLQPIVDQYAAAENDRKAAEAKAKTDAGTVALPEPEHKVVPAATAIRRDRP